MWGDLHTYNVYLAASAPPHTHTQTHAHTHTHSHTHTNTFTHIYTYRYTGELVATADELVFNCQDELCTRRGVRNVEYATDFVSIDPTNGLVTLGVCVCVLYVASGFVYVYIYMCVCVYVRV